MSTSYFLDMQDGYIVSFVDIIGFSSMIKNNKDCNLSTTKGFVINLEKLYEDFKSRYTKDYQEKNNIKILWVSDSFFISTGVNNFAQLIYEMNFICNQLYCCDLSFRGGIATGALHFDTNLWGPAVVEAVELEKKAKFPCIIINKEEVKNIDDFEKYEKYFKPLHEKENEYLYYDFFDNYLSGKIDEGIDICCAISVYADNIITNFDNSREEKHKSKWAFLACELLDFIEEHNEVVSINFNNSKSPKDDLKEIILGLQAVANFKV